MQRRLWKRSLLKEYHYSQVKYFHLTTHQNTTIHSSYTYSASQHVTIHRLCTTTKPPYTTTIHRLCTSIQPSTTIPLFTGYTHQTNFPTHVIFFHPASQNNTNIHRVCTCTHPPNTVTLSTGYVHQLASPNYANVHSLRISTQPHQKIARITAFVLPVSLLAQYHSSRVMHFQ
jgi:hypothetical protein